jgi:hypothetical protein
VRTNRNSDKQVNFYHVSPGYDHGGNFVNDPCILDETGRNIHGRGFIRRQDGHGYRSLCPGRWQ